MSEPAYFTRYENLSFERTEDGILTLRFHTNGGPITFTGRTHQDLPAALEDIALDSDNTGLILTGTGDVFMDSIDGDSLGEIFKPLVWEKIRREGLAVLQRLLSLPIPVVGVANGPATVHSEYLLLTDVHIAPIAPPTATSRIPPSGSPQATACRWCGRRSPAPRERSGCCGRVRRSMPPPPNGGAW